MGNGTFLALLSVENKKMWKRISAIIMLAIMVVIAVGYSCLLKYEDNVMQKSYSKSNSQKTSANYTGQWKQQLKAEITGLNAEIKLYEKDSASSSEKGQVGSLKMQVAEDQYSIDHNIKPEDPNGGLWAKNTSVWTRITDMETSSGTNLGGYIALFAVIICAAAIAGEFSQGTMKTMISRPYSRWQILTAKLLVTVFYGLIVTVVAIAASFITFGIACGFGGMGANEFFWTGSSIIYIPAVCKMLIAYGLEFLKVFFYIILALLLSVLTRSRAFATGISIFLLIVGSNIFEILAYYFPWGKFIPFALTNFPAYCLRGSYIYGTSLGFALILSGIYALVFMCASYFTFAKRDIS